MKEIIVEFTQIGHNGVSIGRYNNKIVFAYGVIPGEKAKILINKEKKNFIEGEVIEIIEKSSYRREPKENHYLSCSPWQVFDYDYQIELKKKNLKDIFKDFAKEELDFNERFFRPKNIWGYRTKIEYSFVEENGKSYLAFHKRGSFKEKIKVDEGCKLISDVANKKALEVLEIINEQKIKNLKSLIIRKSYHYDDLHLSVLTTEKQTFNFQEIEAISGFVFAYSSPKSPTSNFDEILISWGREYLKEKIIDLEILYPYNAFFQNNIELFEIALRKMKDNLGDKLVKVVDLYCGVGVIGLNLNNGANKIIGVEINKSAIDYAKLNAKLNNISNFEGIALASEKISQEILINTDLLILDPPRSGVHKKVINLIIKSKPRLIFYLSCNPLTQARDYLLLKDFYQIKDFYGFDFYPQTPHLESLLILELKH